MEPVAYPGVGCPDIFVTGEVTWQNAEITRVVGDRYGVPKEVMITFTRARTGVHHDGIADIVLAGHRSEGVLGPRLAPRLRIVVANIAGVRNLSVGTHLHAFLRGVGVTLVMSDVRREPQALTAKVQAQHSHLAVNTLVIPFGVAGLLHAVETNTEHVPLTKAPTDVHGPADLAVGSVVAGKRSNGHVGGALGHHVDPATHAAPRRDAIDQLARAFEDVDAIGHFHVDGVRRQDAVETVVGDITVEQAHSANGELLIPPTRRVGGANRGIAGHEVAQGTRLQVFHQLTGVGGLAERRLHEVLRAQQALRSTACHLPADIRITVRRVRRRVNRGSAQLQAAACWHRGQHVRLFAHRLQLQTGTL
ncbi:hypothetical protein D3C86_1233300 [compost metagenome]